ncbi:MAG TPA: PAS domain-containing protein [Anaerolineaceae bacterium]
MSVEHTHAQLNEIQALIERAMQSSRGLPPDALDSMRAAHSRLASLVSAGGGDLPSADLGDLSRRRAEQALRLSEAKLRRLVDSDIIGVFYADTDGHITGGNDAFLAVIGYDQADLENGWVRWSEMTPPEYVDLDREHIAESHLRGACTPYEKEYIRKDGQRVPILIGYAFLDGSDTEYICYIIDLTAQRQAEEALRENRRRLLLATGASGIGTWDWDLQSASFTFDRRAQEIFGFQMDDPQTYERLQQAIHPEDRDRVIERIRSAQLAQEVYEQEVRIVWPDGAVRWVFAKGQTFVDSAGRPARMLGVVIDMTQRREAELNARSVSAQTEVQHRLMDHRERERLSIARDLHDGPVQDLIAISFGLQGVIQEISDPGLVATLQTLRNSVHEVVSSLRNYAGELRPPALAKFGLEKAIRSHADLFRQKHPEIRLTLQMHQVGPLLPEPARLALYRIYQEAMNNVVRHSGASEVVVRFEKDMEQAEFEIRDNGQGFDPPRDWLNLAREGHLGLVGIQERAEAVGGSVCFGSRPGEGTSILVRIPHLSG